MYLSREARSEPDLIKSITPVLPMYKSIFSTHFGLNLIKINRHHSYNCIVFSSHCYMFRPTWPFRVLKKIQNTFSVKHNSKFFKKKRGSFFRTYYI